MIEKYQFSVNPNMQDGPKLSTSWLNYFCRIVVEVASKSKDPSTKVGAIAVDLESKRILATGYNGFPAGVEESEDRWERPTKYDFVVHAEANIIAAAAQFGINLKGAALFVSMHPCVECAKLIAASGIKHIFYIDEELKKEPSREWVNHLHNAESIFIESGITLNPIDVCDITREWVKEFSEKEYDRLIIKPDSFVYKPYKQWLDDIQKDKVSKSRGHEIFLTVIDENQNTEIYITYNGHWRHISKAQWYGFMLDPLKEEPKPQLRVRYCGIVNNYNTLQSYTNNNFGDFYIIKDSGIAYMWNGVIWRVLSNYEELK